MPAQTRSQSSKPPILLIELFRGTGSVGDVASKFLGWEVVSVDIDPRLGATHTCDILALDYTTLPVPDVVWASPPCTTYSIAANWVRHRDPKTAEAWTDAAKEGDRILFRTLEMIDYWRSLNPLLAVCIENPRGYMRHMRCLDPFYRTTTLYSNYGWPVHKATDFWSNRPLSLLPASRPASSNVMRIGGSGWKRKLRDALGRADAADPYSTQTEATRSTLPPAAMLGRIPPSLAHSILSQLLPA